MKFMVIVKATKDSEAGKLPPPELLEQMTRFNEELVKAGVMLAGEGLHPSSKATRVYFNTDGTKKFVDGPFAETKELVSGFWIWQCKSWDEARAWANRIPNPMPGSDTSNVEIRQAFSPEDFAPIDPTGDIRAREREMTRKIEEQQKR